MGFLSIFFFPSPFLYCNLSFDIQKPSHITNIHWKFHDFFPCSLGAIEVLHFTVRSEDGVEGSQKCCQISRNIPLLLISFVNKVPSWVIKKTMNTPSLDRTVKCKTFIAPKPLGKKSWNFQWILVTCDGFCMSKLRS